MRLSSLALVTVLGLSAACSHAPAPIPAPVEKLLAPLVKIALLQDQSPSRNTTRTEVISDAALREILGLLARTGGEIVVGTIRHSSNEPLERLMIVPGPAPPSKPGDGNVFDTLDARAAYDVKLAAHSSAAADWQRAFDNASEAFLVRARRVLTNPVLSRRSAVWDAASRADVALAEPEAGPHSSLGHRYIVLISDCRESTGRTPVTLQSGATIVVVNGAGTLGSFEGLAGVQQFEGLGAAVNWIVRRELALRNGDQ